MHGENTSLSGEENNSTSENTELSVQSESSSIPSESSNTESIQDNIDQVQKEIDKKIKKGVKKSDPMLQNLFNEIQQIKMQLGQSTYNDIKEDQIYDVATEQYYHRNSMEGKIILRELAKEKHQQKVFYQQEEESIKQKHNQMMNTLNEACETIEGFDEKYQLAQREFSPPMARSLITAKDPISIIDYFSKNQNEMNRMKRLPMEDQRKEMAILEYKLQNKPKITTTAPAPLGKSGAISKSVSSSLETISISDRVSQLKRERLKK
jgi:hypothetical protein